MDIQAFEKSIKDYDLSEKAQNALLINDINDYSQFLNINVKNLYYTEKGFKETIDELQCFQDMLKRKSAELGEGGQLKTDSIGLIQKGNNSKEDIVLSAIDEFIDEKGLPQRRYSIFQHLAGKFALKDISAALSAVTMFKSIGGGFYDLSQRWNQRSFAEFIPLLPEPVVEFARYLIVNNNNSYKLVMAYVFIRSMDERGSIYLFKLKNLFYNFYLSRHKKGQIVEANILKISRIGKLTEGEINNMTYADEPLSDFLISDFFQPFSRESSKLCIKNNLAIELGTDLIREVMLIILLKAIDEYYQKISSKMVSYKQTPEAPLEIQKSNPPRSKENSGTEVLSNDSVTTSQRRSDIFQRLEGEFTSKNIPAVLSDAGSRFKTTGDGSYDLPKNLQQMSCKELIDLLPISVRELAQYLVSRNYTSYMLVMTFVFIRSMEEDFSIYIPKLNEMFYNFYLSRYKNNLVMEIKTAVVNRVNELTKNEIKDIACKSASDGLLDSRFFKEISYGRLSLKNNLAKELSNNNVKILMLITLRKAIDDYYQKISPNIVFYEQTPEPPPEIKESCSPKFEEGYCTNPLSDDSGSKSTDHSTLNEEKLADSKESKRFELVQFIKNTKLSVRATNVILQNFHSVEDCYSLNEKTLFDFKNCGRKTAHEILEFFEIIKPEGNFIPPPTIKEQLENPPTENSLSILPIFSSTKLEGLTAEDLHPDFHSSTKFIDILLSTRTSHVLRTKGVKTIGEILFIPGSEFLTWKNFGKKSLNELKDIVRSLCLTGYYSPDNLVNKSAFIDYASYENMISSFVEQCLKNKRDQELSKKRFCFQTGNIPTLEERGQYFGITRERVRQIVKKNSQKLEHSVNLIKLESFWQKLDQAIKSGGGIIHLGALPAALQTEFKWPVSPYPLALGQLLALQQPEVNFKDDCDLITVECECLSCDQVSQQLNRLDFAKHESFHIEVVGAKLNNNCQTQCPWNQPVKIFHKAFIERLIDQSEGRLVLHEDLVLLRSNWLNRYCKKLEDVACHVLECYGKPMHFSEIADQIRSQNQNFKEMSDHNVHASIIRYDKIKIFSRGTYGLKSWGLKRYRSVSSAIEEFIDATGLPQRRQHIIKHLEGEFNEGNITAALSFETRFKSIGEGFYDRVQTWQKKSFDEFIRLLPEPVVEFAQYLTGKNNTSYKLVMAFVFIRSMDQHGAIYLSKLKKNFYNFYFSRHKKGLGVEVNAAVMCHIGELTENEIINRSCKEPLKSFLASNFFILFSQNGRKLRIADFLVSELCNPSVRDVMLLLLLKTIDDYYQKNLPMTITYEQKPEIPLQIQDNHSPKPEENDCPKVLSGDSNPTINIKKKRRGKIRL